MPFGERRQRHLADLGAKTAQRRDRRIDAALRAVADLVVHLVEVVDHADAHALDAGAEQRGVVGIGSRRAGGIARIVAGERLQHQRAVLRGPRHRTDMIERERRGCDAGAADQPIGRLDAGDAAQRRGTADRAAGIGADAAEDQPCRDARAGAAAGTGGEVRGVPRIARRRPGQIERRPAIGELMRRGLAHQHRAGLGQLHRAGRIGVGDVVAQDLRMARGRNALGIDDVLQTDRNAAQRTGRLACHDRRLGRTRIGKRAFLGEQDEGVQLAVQFADAFETGARQLDRRQLLRRDQLRRLGDGGNAAHARSSSAKP